MTSPNNMVSPGTEIAHSPIQISVLDIFVLLWRDTITEKIYRRKSLLGRFRFLERLSLWSSWSWGQHQGSTEAACFWSTSWEPIHWHKTMRGGWLTQKHINFRKLKAHPQWQISPNETIPSNTSKMVPPSNYQTCCHICKHIKAP